MIDSFENNSLLLFLKRTEFYPLYILMLITVIVSVFVSYSVLKGLSPVYDGKYVEISGAVANPGVYYLNSTDRISSLVEISGGFTNEAYFVWISKNLNLAEVPEDASKIYIPFVWEEQFSVDVDLLEIVVKDSPSSESPGPKGLNINTSSKELLEELPGIGPTYAEKIINGRPYSNLQDFVQMSGVPESTISKFSSEITFD